MFLKRIHGPRTVTLPDGTTMTRADLPPVDTYRWVASRKAAVVKAVAAGLISESEAMERYTLSREEFESWKKAVREHGVNGLKVTALKRGRQP
ncbi:Protein of unknown function [Rhodovulum sp. ES.010]|uniref:CtrA inhibitor SciP n=1 Tax=Rhodovulum sp. ES.010 TaxID=1882821 RepID=UPI000928236C|nr:DUF1153 domain-containing protein [Rhodovulum sp. ES.010]SIO18896.1 Protein of unknown function [Rhodovulum sp. ES.010]